MAAPNKEERAKCWAAKDIYWDCLDKNENDISVCSKLKKEYESSCKNAWVSIRVWY